MKAITIIAFFSSIVGCALAVTTSNSWCGKYYEQGYPPVDPGGQFPIPSTSKELLLAPLCSPRQGPYILGETASFIIDTTLTYTNINGAAPFYASPDIPVEVVIATGNKVLALASVPLNVSGFEVPINILELEATKTPYNVSCSIKSIDGREYDTSATLSYMPPNTNGSVTKLDYLTGAVLVQRGSTYESMFPLGYYTQFYALSENLTVLNEMKSQGINIVHIVPPESTEPPYPDPSALAAVMERMSELDLSLMYDMRYDYQNLTAVTIQVEMIKTFNGSLLWYTGDEPDGTSDPLDATFITQEVIDDLDGYHPVSLVLNCENYFFTQYSSGGSIVMEDAYPIGLNATWSVEWDTPCTPEIGDCGCDNCVGNITDVTTRLDEFVYRLEVLRERKSVWAVLQGFGADPGDGYWDKYPTTAEFVAMFVASVNHKATGMLAWTYPAPDTIYEAYTLIGAHIQSITDYVLNPAVVVRSISTAAVDAAVFTLGSESLLTVANLKYDNETIIIPGLFDLKVTQLINTGAEVISTWEGLTLNLGPVGSLVCIVGL